MAKVGSKWKHGNWLKLDPSDLTPCAVNWLKWDPSGLGRANEILGREKGGYCAGVCGKGETGFGY